MPGKVEIQFDMPNKTPAYEPATSLMFTIYPAPNEHPLY